MTTTPQPELGPYGFCVHCGRAKEVNRFYSHEWTECPAQAPGLPYRFCAHCGGAHAQPSRRYVHEECLARNRRD